ncbi:MAG: TRAP transporter substrate-binding protein [Burkholderiales bacterium]|nr:TRAP transporter substrate-binding protein [Burkholderiales bacterium]
MKLARRIALTAAVAAACLAAVPAGAQTTLSMSVWIPQQAPFVQHALVPWAKQVEEATAGRVRVNMLPKAVATPPGHIDAIRDGVADVAFTVQGYTPGRFVLTKVVELPFGGESAEALSVAYQRIHDRFLAKANEHQGLKVLSVFTHGPGAVFTARKPVARLEDFAGLKIRTGGGVVNDLGVALGVTGLMKPANESYEILSSGLADGVFFARESILTFKLGGLVKHATLIPGGMFNTSFVLMMNEARFNALPAADQAAIMKVSGESFGRMAGRSFDSSDAKAVETMRAAGVEIRTADAAFVEQIRKATEPVVNAWIADAGKKGVDGKAAIEALRAESRRVATAR